MKLSRLPAVLIVLALLGCARQAPERAPVEELSADERMGWWREARRFSAVRGSPAPRQPSAVLASTPGKRNEVAAGGPSSHDRMKS